MKEALKRGWCLLVLRGVCAVLFGILALAMPGVTLWLIGAYAILFGIMMLALAFRMKALVSPSRAGSTKLA